MISPPCGVWSGNHRRSTPFHDYPLRSSLSPEEQTVRFLIKGNISNRIKQQESPIPTGYKEAVNSYIANFLEVGFLDRKRPPQ
jgi:hypothetical protein